MHIHHDENIILFPKWKELLEKESLQALKEQHYDKALDKLNQLIHYGEVSHEIMTGKLICLIELGRWPEAQNFCEELLKKNDNNYFNYVHIYLTILFQTGQYDLLMEQVEDELKKKDIPPLQKEQFLQMYEISEKMNSDIVAEQKKVIYEQLYTSVEEENYHEQWRLVQKLKGLHATPTEQIIDMLKKETVHPLTKTAILEWLKESNWSEKVEMNKFNQSMTIVPSELESTQESEIFYETTKFIKDLEQENPTLYQILYQLLKHYVYVLYPIKPPKEDYVYIAQALDIIGRESLGILIEKKRDINQKIEYYIENIKITESLYLSIIDE